MEPKEKAKRWALWLVKSPQFWCGLALGALIVAVVL